MHTLLLFSSGIYNVQCDLHSNYHLYIYIYIYIYIYKISYNILVLSAKNLQHFVLCVLYLFEFYVFEWLTTLPTVTLNKFVVYGMHNLCTYDVCMYVCMYVIFWCDIPVVFCKLNTKYITSSQKINTKYTLHINYQLDALIIIYS